RSPPPSTLFPYTTLFRSLEISPSTHTWAKTSSSSRRALLLSWLTLSTSRSRLRRSKGSWYMAAMIRQSLAARVVAPVGLPAHGADLPVDQRLEGAQQRREVLPGFQPAEGLDDGFQGGQGARLRRLAQPVAGGQTLRQAQARQALQRRIQVQQLARLAPGAVGHHQLQRLLRFASGRRLDGLFAGKQQHAVAGGVGEALGQRVAEGFADQQLRVDQPQRRQARGVQRMAAFVRVLQDQHPGAAVQARDQRAQAVAQRAAAAGTAGAGHGSSLR